MSIFPFGISKTTGLFTIAPANDLSVLGETTLAADSANIVVNLSEPIGDDEYICISYNFVTTAVNQDIRLFYNGDTLETGYTVNGAPNTAKLFTSLNDSARSGFLNVVPNPYAGNLLIQGAGVTWDGGTIRHFKQLTGLDGITSITLSSSTGQLKAGSNVRVTRVSGAGPADGTPTQHGRYSNALKGSTNTNNVQFPTAIGTPSAADFTHNADFATLGSVFTCVSSGWFNFDVVLMLTAAGKGINLIHNTVVSNDVESGTVIAAETSSGAGYANSMSTVRYVSTGEVIYVNLGGSGVINDATTNNIEYNRILITRVMGPGATGATGATGPAGEGAEWQTATQASNGNTLTLALAGGGGALYEIEILVLSQTNGSVIELELNQSAGSYTYYSQFNGTPDVGAGSYVLAGAAASGSSVLISGRAFTSGTTAAASTFSGTTAIGVAQSFIYKTLGAPANLTHITVKSTGANGIGAGSFVKARKIS